MFFNPEELKPGDSPVIGNRRVRFRVCEDQSRKIIRAFHDDLAQLVNSNIPVLLRLLVLLIVLSIPYYVGYCEGVVIGSFITERVVVAVTNALWFFEEFLIKVVLFMESQSSESID